MTTAAPGFPAFLDRPVKNARTGETYALVRADALPASPDHLREITAICNEPTVYDWLFRDRLGGDPYPPERAADFLSWAADGWRNGTHFAFLLLAPDGTVAGALDIKTPDLAAGEVGYWLSARHGGVMSNAVDVLADVARAAGYTALWARVREANGRSAAVLLRAGFEETGRGLEPDLRGGVYRRFRRGL